MTKSSVAPLSIDKVWEIQHNIDRLNQHRRHCASVFAAIDPGEVHQAVLAKMNRLTASVDALEEWKAGGDAVDISSIPELSGSDT